jgi:hypothetical protein
MSNTVAFKLDACLTRTLCVSLYPPDAPPASGVPPVVFLDGLVEVKPRPRCVRTVRLYGETISLDTSTHKLSHRLGAPARRGSRAIQTLDPSIPPVDGSGARDAVHG